MLIEWRLGLGCGGWLVCESCSFQTLFSVRARKQPNALACLLQRTFPEGFRRARQRATLG
jgi:hypothetical protein